MNEQAVVLYISVRGYLMDVPKEKAGGFIKDFIKCLKDNYAETLKAIADTGEITPEIEQQLNDAIEKFRDSGKKA
jgi:F0F1-type ATP synthase alpha subunit